MEARSVRAGLVGVNEAARVPDRQRPEEDRVDQREDRRRGADADRERENREGGEPGILAELAERVFQHSG
jgi:hypothetical protein